MSESLVVPSALAYLYADTLQDLFCEQRPALLESVSAVPPRERQEG